MHSKHSEKLHIQHSNSIWNYLTTPGLAWDACMKVTKVKLELFNEHQGDMHGFFTTISSLT